METLNNMDDQHFDQTVKSKLSGLAPEFDPAALESFRSQMDGVVRWRMWRNWLGQLLWPLLILLTISNGFFIWSWRNIDREITNMQAVIDKGQEHVTDTLYLSGEKDTVYVNTYLPATTSGRKGSYVQETVGISQQERIYSHESAYVADKTNGKDEQQPETIYKVDPDNEPVPSSAGKELVSTEDAPLAAEKAREPSGREQKERTDALTEESEQLTNEPEKDEKAMQERKLPPEAKVSTQPPIPASPTSADLRKEASVQRRAERERGLILGLEGDGFYALPERGDGLWSPGIGVKSEWILSKHLRIHTGLEMLRTRYEGTVAEIYNYVASNPIELDPALGPYKIEFRINTTELPLQLKYYSHLNENNRLFIGLGWSPALYWYQFRSEYYQQNGRTYLRESESHRFRLKAGYAGMTVGYERPVATRFRWQLAAYYDHALEEAGEEQLLVHKLGFRISFWFDLK